MTNSRSKEDERDIDLLTNSIFNSLLFDTTADITLSAHKEIKRGRADCGRCGMKCRSRLQLPPLPSQKSSSTTATASASNAATPSYQPALNLAGLGESRSRSSTPQPMNGDAGIGNGGAGPNGGIVGNGGVVKNGNHYFPCLVCSKQVASSRYAPHLSSCLGLTGSTRRAAARGATAGAGASAGASGSGGSGWGGWGNVKTGRTDAGKQHHYAHSDSGRGGEGDEDDAVFSKSSKPYKKNASPVGKGVSLFKKSKSGGIGNRSGSAPPSSLLINKSRPTHPLPPSKLRGASPSITTVHTTNKYANAPSTGSSLTSFPASDGRNKRGVVVVDDDDDDDEMEFVA